MAYDWHTIACVAWLLQVTGIVSSHRHCCHASCGLNCSRKCKHAVHAVHGDFLSLQRTRCHRIYSAPMHHSCSTPANQPSC
ncbi:hypothetical protein COO60DRAFT_1530681 [Scenedesmus sp. NREL 46B-D3]|nr:hypothetical protein COO60DRAFT_1530681 [Scenedesmus sp. NREL 46B-D3]